MFLRPLLYACVVALCGIASPALAQTSSGSGSKSEAPVPQPIYRSPAERYEACTKKIDQAPQDAFEDALYWYDHGGGEPAEHCAALALVAAGEPAEAAKRLDALARVNSPWTLPQRANLLDQSGNAWLLARNGDNAEEAFSAALKLAPRDADIWTDRARARAMKKDWAGAESDLNNALTFSAKNPEIYVLRSAARKEQGKAALARADINAALKLDGGFPEALVERGAMRLAAGDKEGARADWRQVLIRAPKSAAGDAARAHIEKLEVDTSK